MWPGFKWAGLAGSLHANYIPRWDKKAPLGLISKKPSRVSPECVLGQT